MRFWCEIFIQGSLQLRPIIEEENGESESTNGHHHKAESEEEADLFCETSNHHNQDKIVSSNSPSQGRSAENNQEANPSLSKSEDIHGSTTSLQMKLARSRSISGQRSSDQDYLKEQCTYI